MEFAWVAAFEVVAEVSACSFCRWVSDRRVSVVVSWVGRLFANGLWQDLLVVSGLVFVI